MNLSDISVLQFEPTSHCNSQCPHCPRFNCIDHDIFESTGTLHPDLNLSHIDIDKVIGNLQLENLTSLKKVVLEGDKGDPVMHPQIEKFITAFSSMATPPLILMTTNGSIRNEKWWKNLGEKRYPNLKVIFSIDGLADTNHLYRVGVDFEKIITNAQAFIDAGGYAVWHLLVFKHNQHQLDEIKKLSYNMGFAKHSIRPADASRFKGLDRWPVKTEFGTHYLEVTTENDTRINQEYIFKHPFIPYNPPFSNVVERICPNLATGHIYITHENYVIPCCMMHLVTEQNYFGRDDFLKLSGDLDQHNLSKHTLETILNNKFFSEGLVNSLKNNNWHYICASSCHRKIGENIKKLEAI